MHKILAIVATIVLTTPAFGLGWLGWLDKDDHHHDGGRGYHPAPAPIAGAGLIGTPIAFGLYWLLRRRR